MRRKTMRWLAIALVSGQLIASPVAPAAPACSDLLLIWDENDGRTAALRAQLEAAGFFVTMSDTDENGYDGTNPATEGFDVVIRLNGVTYGGEMPSAGQAALVEHVAQGGGYVHTEWDAFETSIGRLTAMRDLVLFDRSAPGSTGPVTVSTVAGMEDHPVLEAVPASTSVDAAYNNGSVHAFATDPTTVLMRDAYGNDAVAVRSLTDGGRIVGFHHAGNYGGSSALTQPDVLRLFINAASWTCPDRIAPTVSFDSPENGGVYVSGNGVVTQGGLPTLVIGGMTLEASATDNVGVIAATFSEGSRVICVLTEGPYTCPYNPSSSGAHTLTFEAEDAAGNTSSVAIDVIAAL